MPVAGGFLLLGALIRVILPERRAGWFAIRGKTTDALTLTTFGALLVFGGLILLVEREWIVGILGFIRIVG
ncbi:hypothetical protein Misp01_06280 [Microtetraspora sp. NBRC 13810]|nr:hypothetical protein Misp01_06280 [Microtetraspora sp. NBRC 13810]